jgi:hypothetical protein
MNIIDILTNTHLQNTILHDTQKNTDTIPKIPAPLIGKHTHTHTKKKNNTSRKNTSLKKKITIKPSQNQNQKQRPLPIAHIIHKTRSSSSSPQPHPNIKKINLIKHNDPQWKKTWFILSLIYLSPQLKHALNTKTSAPDIWLNGSKGPNFNIHPFTERYSNAITQRVITPLEFVANEITLATFLHKQHTHT